MIFQHHSILPFFIALILVGCGLKEPKYKNFENGSLNLAECNTGQEYFARIAAPFQQSCLACHGTSLTTNLKNLSTPENIATNRKTMRESSGWKFASSSEHQGKSVFLKMFPNQAAYTAFMQVEQDCK